MLLPTPFAMDTMASTGRRAKPTLLPLARPSPPPLGQLSRRQGTQMASFHIVCWPPSRLRLRWPLTCHPQITAAFSAVCLLHIANSRALPPSLLAVTHPRCRPTSASTTTRLGDPYSSLLLADDCNRKLSSSLHFNPPWLIEFLACKLNSLHLALLCMSSKLGPHPYARFSPSPTCAEQPLCSANRTQETSAYGASLYSATAFLMRLSLDTVSARRSGSARHSSLLQPDACAYDHAVT
mmetsp:Transcript_22496/g.68574  ORF Transcript_22496/g.68574 Transcript_22496/m.68574 type:complete len:238 (-) Transcript_22496:936-1649(-)